MWCSLQLVTVWAVSPDLSVAAFVYVATALVIRMWRRPRLATMAVLGAVLGAGYLAKAPMLVLAVVFLLVSAATLRRPKRVLQAAAVGLLACAVVAGPFIVALSMSKGRITFGDSRVLAYAWIINGVPLRNWQGGEEAGGRLLHPTRQLSESPAVFEFGTPLRGTYPVWYDPSYWYDGIKPAFSLAGHMATLVESAREYHAIVLGYVQSALLTLLIVCAYVGWPLDPRRWVPWVIVIPAAAGLAMYSVVLVLGRYIGPFGVVFWIGLYSWIRLPKTSGNQRLLWATCAVICAMVMLTTAVATAPDAVRGIRQLMQGEGVVAGRAANEAYAVAAAMRRRGIDAGDTVAIIYPPPESRTVLRMVAWARLARVKIVAEVPPEAANDFWVGDDRTQQRVIDTLRSTAARSIVTMAVPEAERGAQWESIAGTDHYVYAGR
jgi:hypothetical protein